MKRIFGVLMLAVVLFSLTGCSDNKVNTTTVLVYMEGTDLEKNNLSATKNIQEMLAATASGDVKIILQTGAADKDGGTLVKSWKTVKRHIIINNTITELNDLGAIDMGTPEALTDFITWGQNAYPADHYVLVFWDHGGGTQGGFGGGDNALGTSNLSVEGMRKGVADAVAATGKRFELIGFDACLMATLEVAYNFKDVSHYLIASEELEPGNGWDWKAMMNSIASNPGASGKDIGIAIANSYYAKMVADSTNASATLSVIDLSQIKPLNDALAVFATWQEGLIGSVGTKAWTDLAYSRSRSMDFDTNSLDAVDTADMVDLLDLVSIMSQDYSDAPQIKAIQNAMAQAVVYKVAGPLRANSSGGLSVMFPTSTVWSPLKLTAYQALKFVPEYQSFVNSYSNYAKNTMQSITIAAPVLASAKITAGIITPVYQYEQAYIAMTDGAGTYYGHQPIQPTITPSTLEAGWDGSWYTLNGQTVSVLASPATEPVVSLRIPIEVTYTPAGGTGPETGSGFYCIRYDYINGIAEYQGFLPDLNKQASRGFVQLPAGATIKPMVYKPDTTKPMFGKWETNGSSFVIPAGGLITFAKTALPSASYKLAFVLYDLRLKPAFSPLLTVVK